jgi:phospholipid/cholesterol/gamma-HCH transport system substrate-binding protein
VPGGDPTSGFAGTRAEQDVVNSLLAARTGRPADSFASVTTLLYGPLLRGTEVSG